MATRPSNSDKLLEGFLDRAKRISPDIELIKVLKSRTYRIGNANILIRTASEGNKTYFFGLNYINAEEIYNLENSFFAFICGSVDKVVFLPADILIKLLPDISHDRNGEYKINFNKDCNLALKGRGNTFDCSGYLNTWGGVLSAENRSQGGVSADESLHNVIQGRLIEIGNIRGYQTYSPDKSKKFNKKQLQEITSLKSCPELQWADHSSLRNIDVIWFREVNKGYYPEYAFEVELSTGVWSGFGRLASLREYNTRFYIVTNEEKRFAQVASSFHEYKSRYINIEPEKVGLLYSAEKNLIRMREEFNL
ncbi:MAG: hypothetical protein ACKVRP_15985 [Bacteroidota bacterium]